MLVYVLGLLHMLLAAPEAVSATWPIDLSACREKESKRCYVSQGFAEYNNVYKGRYHTGIDIAASEGTPVRAVAKGTVVLIQENGKGCRATKKVFNDACKDTDDPTDKIFRDHGYGNTIVIWHEDLGLFTQYSHLMKKPALKPGDRVSRGKEIGLVGKTGSDGTPWPSHLHFESKIFPQLRNYGDKRKATEIKDNLVWNCAWGYSEDSPERCGYRDPTALIFEVYPLARSIPVTLGDEVNVRPAPPPIPPQEPVRIGQLLKGSNVIGIEEVREGAKYCVKGWYRIRHPEKSAFVYAYDKPVHRSGSITIATAWICKDFIEKPVASSLPTLARKRAQIGLATALVIDRSGSMKGEKLRKAKAGAGAYVKLLEPADYASVSSFSDTASTELPMSPQATARKQVDTVLDAIASTAATNIGAGLEQGFKQLQGLGGASREVGLLLSDGMNNRGDWSAIVGDYKSKGWPIYTIAYGGDADEKTLEHIAEITGGRHWPSGTTIGVYVYCQINNDVNNRSGSLAVSDNLGPGGAVVHLVHVAPGAENLTGCVSWQGSKLETVLVSPTGLTIGKDRLTGKLGRYDEGKTYQVFKIYNPQPGRWQVRVRWIEPPAAAERVNISISEKSDAFGQILGFKPEYQPGEPVRINVEVAEVVGYERVPLLDARVRVQVQKPGGPKMAQMIRTRPINLRSAKRTIQGATRNIRLHDDGAHNDYRAGDGIFGGTFTETDENGAYLVIATVTGHKRNGQRVQRKLIASFQVGPISQNPVTTAQVLEVRDLLEDRTDPSEAIEALQSDPLAAIKGSQSDPLDAINKLRQGVQ